RLLANASSTTRAISSWDARYSYPGWHFSSRPPSPKMSSIERSAGGLTGTSAGDLADDFFAMELTTGERRYHTGESGSGSRALTRPGALPHGQPNSGRQLNLVFARELGREVAALRGFPFA